ncbi:MAG: LysR family transcriptional regulator [Rhodoferax sp.]|nr:LysR family transcriptional regulator [Rhodoferax sp.]MCB2004340.1 LysR family transcriptional regulator [Rhodoferax sp.]MCB2027823.1 LysR family transcriptional regulator [Rhodoferax sp.]MCB2039463.1 LysR family transcriptional regulator [Rhodoferax sp.]MCP5264303.1 LysR family transcriptional regulator [Rhodoferax sp.]
MDRVFSLQLFIRVVETGSFSRAAEEFGITQPTVTKALAATEKRLGARLLHRSTRGVTPTEVGQRYYERCLIIARDIDEAENVAALLQSEMGGTMRISTSVAFGRRVMAPLVLRYMRLHPKVVVDLSFDDRYVDLVEQGVDVALRMGRLADSTLGARYLGKNPWLMVAAPAYLETRGVPRKASDLARHDCLIYSSVQGDARWSLTPPGGKEQSVPVKGQLRSNSLSAVLDAAIAGMGLAILPWYVAGPSVAAGRVRQVLTEHGLPTQDLHAVFPSPKLVPAKVIEFIEWLAHEFDGEWWRRVG